MLRNTGSLPGLLLPSPSSLGSPVQVRFFRVWARQRPALESPPGHYLPKSAHRLGPHLCGRFSAAPCRLGHGDRGPRTPPRAPSPAGRPEQRDRHNSTVTQPCADVGAQPLPSAGRRGHRAASGSEMRGAALGDPYPRRRSPLHLLLLPVRGCPLPLRPPPPPPPRRPAELLGGAPVPEPPGARGCGLRAKREGGSDPGVPEAAAGGGDGKRKRRAAPSRSRTLEELHACGGRLRPRGSVAGGQPCAAERATLSRGQLPELGGINRVPPGLKLGAEGRRLFLIVAVSGHPRGPPELADSANHLGRERQREIQRRTQGKGWGKDRSKQRAAEGGGDPRRGGGGAPRHRKQSGAGRLDRGSGVEAGLG